MKHTFDIRVLQCVRLKHEGDSRLTPRLVMDYEFDFCVGCDREIWIDGKNYKVSPGCFIIRKPNQIACSKGLRDCYILTLDFSHHLETSNYSRNTATQMQQPFDSNIWDILPTVFKPAHTNDYLRIFEQLTSINQPDVNKNEQTAFLVNQLLHLLIADAYLNTEPTEQNTITPLDDACTYIKNNFNKELRLEDIASVVHLNKTYFVRLFKKYFGISPIAYLIKYRMDYAKKLLQETTLPIKVVALECGYNEPTFFNTYFKKTFSVTPEEYRKAFQTKLKR